MRPCETPQRKRTKKRMRGQLKQRNGYKSKYHKSPPSVNDENARARSPDKVTANHSLTTIMQVIHGSGGSGEYLMIPLQPSSENDNGVRGSRHFLSPEGLILAEVAQTKKSAENVQNHSKKLKKK